jgi:hypothetical protein
VRFVAPDHYAALKAADRRASTGLDLPRKLRQFAGDGARRSPETFSPNLSAALTTLKRECFGLDHHAPAASLLNEWGLPDARAYRPWPSLSFTRNKGGDPLFALTGPALCQLTGKGLECKVRKKVAHLADE